VVVKQFSHLTSCQRGMSNSLGIAVAHSSKSMPGALFVNLGACSSEIVLAKAS
jgi:hypothetical protein